ncbi:SGNH/GDSL hydrolase family protein [Chryseobacterium sp. WG14]|uniref:SGNH/GDSL hydrolase family protein n=1 Tax=Chryseobacterium sp. WG14 TaxID=2926909 RepID=UPI00211EA834|nr:SGNH/GDSL hydrolase family protein [Chryseobacterium sp. WG14]MCQ9638594.1 SGNH/GDSL hydrolase family protein [Chryseobacterium sp. WG14]
MAIIGIIYSKTNFTDLIDFDLKGNWQASSGKLTTLGNNSILQYKRASALDDFTWRIRTNSEALNIQIYGIRSVNNIRTTLSLETGKAKYTYAFNNTSGLSSTQIIIESNDVLEYQFTKSQWACFFTVKNVTKGTESTVLVPVAITINKLRAWSATACEITSIIKTSQQGFKPLNLLVGDSISYGSSATSVNLRWGSVAGFQVEGSPGDTSSEAMDLIHEIINIIKPSRVVYAFGTNDLDIELWKTNLQSFRTISEQNYIVFIPITPYANSNRDMTAYQSYITANFSKYFDIFSITKQSGNPNMKTEYNSGDNIHPNNLGHNAIGNYVLASPYYNFEPLVPQGSSAILSAIVDKWYSNY